MLALRKERISQGLSQKAVADIANISLSIVSKYETGRYPTRLVWYAAQLNALGFKMVVRTEEDGAKAITIEPVE